MRRCSFLKSLALISVALSLTQYAQAAASDTFNVRIAPLSLIVGVLNVDGDIGVAQSTTVGPSISLFNRSYSGATYIGSSFGVRANFYLGHGRFTDSWIIGPYLDFLALNVAEAPYNNIQLNGSLVGCAIAYQWVWPSGFNLDLGGTFGTYGIGNNFNLTDNNGNTTTITSPYTGGFLSIEFTLGYAF